MPATAAGATAFVAEAEARLAALSEEAARIQWSRATNITHDTMWLESRINAEYTELQVELANGAARFNDVEVPADWSQLATDIVVSMYFRRAGVPGTEGCVLGSMISLGAAQRGVLPIVEGL